MRYSRSLPSDSDTVDVLEATNQVRAHLSAVADADDDPDTHADEVRVWTADDGEVTTILGELDAEPDAPYLRADYDPDADTEFTYQRWDGGIA